jgi:hypothetical protein
MQPTMHHMGADLGPEVLIILALARQWAPWRWWGVTAGKAGGPNLIRVYGYLSDWGHYFSAGTGSNGIVRDRPQ